MHLRIIRTSMIHEIKVEFRLPSWFFFKISFVWVHTLDSANYMECRSVKILNYMEILLIKCPMWKPLHTQTHTPKNNLIQLALLKRVTGCLLGNQSIERCNRILLRTCKSTHISIIEVWGTMVHTQKIKKWGAHQNRGRGALSVAGTQWVPRE